jgi:hypothetical protein
MRGEGSVANQKRSHPLRVSSAAVKRKRRMGPVSRAATHLLLLLQGSRAALHQRP